MVASRIARWLAGRRRRPIDALQVEVTTHCLLRCSFCPHETLRSQWTPRHMPLALFERLVPSLPQVRFVHLQGWGEPLLNPDLFRMIELARGAGCQVVLTTSGVLLGKGVGERLAESGLDLLAISIAGAKPETHGHYRVGSELPAILEGVAAAARHRERLGLRLPQIVFLYTMLRSNIRELPGAVKLAREVGADRLVATNLDYVGCEAQDVARAFSVGEADPPWLEVVQEARRLASDGGLEFRPYPLRAHTDVLMCEAMVSPTAVIAADGGLFPCVYLSVPVDPLPRFFHGERFEIPRRPFGNLQNSDLISLWNGPEYQAFRGSFQARQSRNTRQMFDLLLAQQGAADLSEKPDTLFEQLQRETPLPPVCATCHKAYGL